MTTPTPDITLYFLGASRAIRIAWLLEELSLPYTLVASPRATNGLAPPEFKDKIPTAWARARSSRMGMSSCRRVRLLLSTYLCETCDGEARLLPRETKARAKVREFMAAAEATFMLHALAILYARWRLPERAADCLPEMEKGLSSNVHNDFAWLEHELAASSDSGASNGADCRDFLVGGHLTAADIIMGFSIEFIFARKLGTERDGRWPRIQHWLDRIRDEPSYKKAVERTGYKL